MLSGVPNVIGAGVAQVTVGVALSTVWLIGLEALAPKLLSPE